ncbi:kunitz-type trypsin inhibitor alpha chain-like [Silene latifolia]|uniref:kunitz-type trypsin inhibitor alpha chain-like n=1 Tax=Silene latifolia TaxID=37657 RepID=UPI003D770B4A
MSSLLLFFTSITLVLLLIFPSSTAFAFVVDTDGHSLQNGRKYFIIPVTSKGGLTYTQKNGGCPLYITSNKTENSPGTPVKISSPFRIPFIYPNLHISLTFNVPTPCGESVRWKRILDPSSQKAYITAGSDDDESVNVDTSFIITEEDESNQLHIYELKHWSFQDGYGYNVGLFKDDGLLGLTNNPTAVSFKKAFNFLELSTS